MGRHKFNSRCGRKSTLSSTKRARGQRRGHNRAALTQRGRGHKNERLSFSPPETWYEPDEDTTYDYRIVVQDPGEGYRHILTPDEIRTRLNKLPREMIEPLEVVQLSQMTRKKQSFPCYGMQWGATLYLYPMEDHLTEYFSRPPSPAQRNEARMYGGRWVESPGEWQLVWTDATIKDFYLNNILIHELGHLLDSRNSSYIDRERYAEWFAIEHGYRTTKPKSRPNKRVNKRHHGK